MFAKFEEYRKYLWETFTVSSITPSSGQGLGASLYEYQSAFQPSVSDEVHKQ